MKSKFKYDGKSRPTNKAYDDSYKRIFGVKSKSSEHDDTLKTSLTKKKETNDKKK